MTKILSERRAADRAEMANRIEALLKELSVDYDRREGGDYPGKHAIQIHIRTARGLQVMVEFDKNSTQPDVHVLSWNIAYDSDARISEATFGGSVNPVHKHKATYVAYGFDDLCTQLRSGLELAASGRAFLN